MTQSDLLKFRDKGYRLYVVATGVGASIQQRIWEVPGCSSFFQGASFPYSKEETDGFLGFVPNSYCSEETAIDLALAAYRRALSTDPNSTTKAIGLAVTGVVTSLHPHKGEHRAHVCIVTDDGIWGDTIVFPKVSFEPDSYDNWHKRSLDETRVTNFAMLLLCHLDMGGWHNLTEKARKQLFAKPLFMNGKRFDPQLLDDVTTILFPGSFNPVHYGHRALVRQLQLTYNKEVVYSICSTPPHKFALTVQEMLRRGKLIGDNNPVLFTEGDALFLEKAKRFPNRTFVVGADTLIRLFDPIWGPTREELARGFQEIGTSFAVFGREIDGTWLSAREAINRVYLPIGPGFQPIEGRWDVSSSELRSGK